PPVRQHAHEGDEGAGEPVRAVEGRADDRPVAQRDQELLAVGGGLDQRCRPSPSHDRLGEVDADRHVFEARLPDDHRHPGYRKGMGQAYLLTGRPGVGKTTCVRRTLERLHVRAGGFFTAEMRVRGTRVGFALETLDGQRATLAHVKRAGPPRVGKYGVDVAALERVGVPAIRAAVRARRLVVIDEIGKMELASAAFRAAVEEALARDARILGTILAAAHPWADTVKRHPSVTLIEVTAANRE